MLDSLFFRIAMLRMLCLSLLLWCHVCGIKAQVSVSEPPRRHNGPCHEPYKYVPSNCNLVAVPRGMCSACPLGDYDESGNFYDCTSIYDIAGDPCIAKLQEYVDMNPCDDERRKALRHYTNATATPEEREYGRLVLDYFMYSVCEQACDCVPQIDADPVVPSISLERGNCQVHAFYDVLNIHPRARIIMAKDSVSDPWPEGSGNWPRMRQPLGAFMRTLERNFLTYPNVTVQWEVARYLEYLVEAGAIFDPIIYQSCVGLESSQRRISIKTPNPTTVQSTTSPSVTPLTFSDSPSTAPVEQDPAPTMEVDFVLVQASTATDLLHLVEGTTFDLSEVGTDLSVRAEITESAKCAELTLDDGPTQRECLLPFALGGDQSGESYNTVDELAVLGSHVLTVKFFDQNDLVIGTRTISFSVIRTGSAAPSVAPMSIEIVLVRAATGVGLLVLEEDTIYDLHEVGTDLSIRADIETATCAELTLDDGPTKRECVVPFALAGDKSGTSYTPVKELTALGLHLITINGVDESNAIIASRTISFYVTRTGTIVPTSFSSFPSLEPIRIEFVLVRAATATDLAVLDEGTTYNLAEVGTDLSIRADISRATCAELTLDSRPTQRECWRPFALAGDVPGESYTPVIELAAAGQHELTAKALGESGDVLGTWTIRFFATT